MSFPLAIVIPAYKAIYFKTCIESLVAQTDQRFHVYIGDDASPEDLNQLLAPYASALAITYHRFDQNLGATDLVGHWNRCLDLIKEESWIWLFSDDDCMDPGCVEAFYDFLETPEAAQTDLLHFNMQVVDSDGIPLWPIKPFPSELTSVEFFDGRIQHQLHSSVVEYIFRKSAFKEVGGFQKFDLGWFSDDATWLKLMGSKPLITISKNLVYWRFSSENISSTSASREILGRKVEASLTFRRWAIEFLKQRNFSIQSSNIQQIKFFLSVPFNSSRLNWKEKSKFLTYISSDVGANRREKIVLWCYFLWFFGKQTLGLWLRRRGTAYRLTSTTSALSSDDNT